MHKFNKRVLALFLALAVLFKLAPAIYAKEECTTTTGSYGQTSTTCKVLGETTTHETVDAGVGDLNYLVVSMFLFGASVVVFGIAHLAKRAYWFD